MADDKGLCCKPAPPSDQVAVGKTEKWDGLDVYVNGPTSSKSAVILVTDIFGWEVPQVREIADFFASNGFLTLIPDIIHNDPYSPELDFGSWLTNHPPAGEVPNVKKTIAYASSHFGITSFALTGFCWGAKVSTLSYKADEHVKALIFFHPSFVTIDDVKGLHIPVAIFGAGIDQISPPKLVTEFKSILESNPNVGPSKTLVKIIPDVEHGFGVRYDPKDEKALKIAKDAHAEALTFLKSL